ncbi:MAG: hypothetical protein NTV89_05970, partial [Proteobacteria bacterium]|nr:hypothetical protein [Pseudomonadota bacterium]
TRIIPIVIDGTSPPAHLRALKWVDITVDYEGAVRELQKAIFQFYEKPPIGQQPEFLRGKVLTVGGLSRVATAVGFLLVGTGKHDIGNEENFSPKELQERLGLSVEEINDAIEELENHGIVEALQELGTYPYSHSQVTPTYALFLHFKGQGLDYDPDEDIKAVAAAIVVKNKTDGNALKEVTGLSPLRLNRAVNYLKDDGIIEVLQYLGTAPFDFGEVWATGATRRFVAENCK